MKFRITAVTLALLSATSATAQAPGITLHTLADGLSGAIGVASAHDGTGRLFGIEQDGIVKVWTGADEVLATSFLDLSTIVSMGGERGLLGLAFHPNYEGNGFFFVNYTNLAGNTVVARYSVSANPNVANPASALQILTFTQPAGNHNGGDMHFGADGYLYISSGDGGAGGGPAQDPNSLLGKLLRVDVDSDAFPGDPARNYAIPPGNPFAVSGGAPEVWLLGLRNPWRFSIDRATGEVFIGDVGEGTWEEISVVPPDGGGLNLGWPCYEGEEEHNTGGCGPSGDYHFPIATLPHAPDPNNNCSVIGGYRYQGTLQPSLAGWYFFKDWCTGTLWGTREVGGNWETATIAANLDSFFHTGFTQDDEGEIYLVGNWNISRLLGPDAIFLDGFETGSTSAWSGVSP